MSESNLYVSFHGGTGAGTWNNIHAYDAGGTKIGKTLDRIRTSTPRKAARWSAFMIDSSGTKYGLAIHSRFCAALMAVKNISVALSNRSAGPVG